MRRPKVGDARITRRTTMGTGPRAIPHAHSDPLSRGPRVSRARGAASRPRLLVRLPRVAEVQMPDRMKDKVVLVCGAGSCAPGWGNGKAAAVLYAREGAHVFAVDKRLDAALETREIIASEGGDC